MKAFHPGRCMACKQSIQQGSEIARLLGKYVHQACKDRHLAEKRSEGRVTALPERVTYMQKDGRKQVTSKRGYGSSGQIFL